MSWQTWLKTGWLAQHQPSRQEITDLLAVADRDWQDRSAKGHSPDWRLNIADNAALQSATAAFAASGFRAAREAHHVRVIQSLAFTIGADTAVVDQRDLFRQQRNIGGSERTGWERTGWERTCSERTGTVSHQEAQEMNQRAKQLRSTVEAWLKQTAPQLL
jgi:hypothetical protein